MSRLLKLLLVAAFVIGAAGCHDFSEAPAVPRQPAVTSSELRSVEVVRPHRHTVIESIKLPGDLVGFYETALHSKVTGYLVKINVDKGDRVKTGQVLAVLEVPELRENLARAQAALEISKLTWERLDHVRKTDPRLVAKEAVDIAYAKYMESKASVGELQTMLSYTKIVAPFDGVITGRFADPGALIRAGGGDFGISGSGVSVSPGATEGAGGHLTGGGPILTEAKIDELRVYVYVPEGVAGLVRVGMPASMTMRAFPGRVIHASVTRYARALDLATRTMLTEIDIPNPTGALYPRMYVNVKLVLAQHPNALEVPQAAVYGIGQQGTYIYLVEHGRLRKTPVTTGLRDGSNIEITTGLNENDEVVARNSLSLAPGEPVQVVLAQSNPNYLDPGHGE